MDDIIIEPPQLEAEIIEYILFNSIAKISFNDLLYKIQNNLPISSFILKKYLYHLIEYGLLSYEGQFQKYIMEDEAFNMLTLIYNEKIDNNTNIHDILITFDDIRCL